MNLKEFSKVNRRRSEIGFGHDLDDWSPAEWTNAMCGEAGEAANVAKKMLRIRDMVKGNKGEDTDLPHLTAKLIDELADVIIYADLCIQRVGGDTADAVVSKFNRTSEKIDSDIRFEG